MIAAILVDGVFLGAVLSLASLGLSLAYAVFRFPNFAHADLLTIAAFAAWAGATSVTDAPVLSLVAAVAAASLACVGLILLADRLVLRRLLARRQSAAVIIAAFAIGLLLRNLVVLLFGPGEVALDRDIEIAAPVLNMHWLQSARLTATEQGVIVATLALVLLLHLLLRRTGIGRDLRAVAENPELAGICGIRLPLVRGAAWALAGFSAALAGVALLLLGPVRPETGAEFMLPALAAVVVGGLGSIMGMLGGALLIGLAESAAVHLGLPEWRSVVSFVVVVFVLFLRPSGLFGRRG